MRNTHLAVILLLAFLNVPLTGSAEEIIVMFPKFEEIEDPNNEKVMYEKMGSWNKGEYIEKELIKDFGVFPHAFGQGGAAFHILVYLFQDDF